MLDASNVCTLCASGTGFILPPQINSASIRNAVAMHTAPVRAINGSQSARPTMTRPKEIKPIGGSRN